MNPPRISPELLDRYLADRVDDEERARVAAWLDVAPVRRDVLAALHARPERDTDMWLERVKAALAAEASQIAMPPVHVPPDTRRRARWLASGAGLVIVVALGIVLPRVWQHGVAAHAHAVLATSTYHTQRAQRASLQLPDGSFVSLAPETELRYTLRRDGERVVDLQGEASFTVSQHATSPFTVRTGAVHTRVLGTQFDVRHYASDRTVQVAVASGRVAVTTENGRAGSQSTVIPGGTIGVVADSTVAVVSVDSVRPYTTWSADHLVLRGVPMPEVLATLTRWYGYQFRLSDTTLKSHNVTAVLDAASLSNSLNTLKLILNVDVTIDGGLITLHPRHPAATRRGTRDALQPLSPEVGR